MENNLPLYSRGRPLKNLIADWQKYTTNSNILVGRNYNWNSNAIPMLQEETELYRQAINYWYFSEIGFDSDEVFIKRFNDIYYSNIDRFEYILSSIEDGGYSWEKVTKNGTLSRTGKDTDTETGSRQYTQQKSGSDVFRKGVTTTSIQSTENEGNKLTRNTPNEKLGVSGSSNTTVADSGQDTTEYGAMTTNTETPNVNKEKNYNSTFTDTTLETREKLTLDEVERLQKMKSIYKQFALLFENIFMGVL